MYRQRTSPVFWCAVAVMLLSLFSASTEAMNKLDAQPTKAVRTPFGYYPAECVHGVPAGSIVEDDLEVASTHFSVRHPDGFKRTIRRCGLLRGVGQDQAQTQQKVSGQGYGWQAYTYQNINNVTAMLGQFQVPQDPATYDDQTIFLFPGLQNINWIPPDPQPKKPFDIIQPVLQYGNSAAGGDSYWAIASWYVTLTDDVVYSELVQVNNQDLIFGNMTKTGSNSWYINTATKQQKTDMTISRPILATQPWAYVTLEAYGIYNCDLYPTSPIVFNNLQMYVNGKQVTPQWTATTKNPYCNSSAKVIDPATVQISFQ
eukprot:TRINITY_DN3041_c0_g1_i1.p1 TRINITY_DN3041_c0_g1~~TRINITY_DN3041_c0_g1_i1.p1  ORF type:complete len:315 (-),score=75.59 TRINITY_DN3041_c0_g1_i1:57-1001(-)